MVIISGRSSLADAKSNDNLLPGDAFHIHNTITNTITVMKVIHYIFTPSSSLYCRWCTTPTWTPLSPAMPLGGSLDPFCRFVWNLIISNVVIIFLKLFQLYWRKIFFRTGQTWGRVGYTESGKRVRVLPLYNYRFPSERNFLQGPWIGFKTPEKAVGSYGWVGVIITRIRRRIIGCLLIDLLLSLFYFVWSTLYSQVERLGREWEAIIWLGDILA